PLEEQVRASLADDACGIRLQDEDCVLLDTQADRAPLDPRRVPQSIEPLSVAQQVGQTLETSRMGVEILVYDRSVEERQPEPQFGPHPPAVDRRVPGNNRLRQARHAGDDY